MAAWGEMPEFTEKLPNVGMLLSLGVGLLSVGHIGFPPAFTPPLTIGLFAVAVAPGLRILLAFAGFCPVTLLIFFVFKRG